MTPRYADIIDLLGPPVWYDQLGVPRYAPFEPGLCSTAHHAIALVRVVCTCCGVELDVAHGWARHNPDRLPFIHPQLGTLGTLTNTYPPFHLNAELETCTDDLGRPCFNQLEPRQVLRYHQRTAYGWERVKAHEIPIAA